MRSKREYNNIMRSKYSVQIDRHENNQEELLSVSCRPCNPAENSECDACPCCNDTCGNPSCLSCIKKKRRPLQMVSQESNWLMGALSNICTAKEQLPQYSVCQLRRHASLESAWILVGRDIYDATPYIKSHPGGSAIIVKKAGGATDCTEDMNFHSKRAQREWKRYKVGTLCQCPRSC